MFYFCGNPAICASRQSFQNVRTRSSRILEPLHALHGFMVICSWQAHFTHFAKPQRDVAMKARKKCVNVLLLWQPCDMRISSVFSKCENPLFPYTRTPSCPSWLHGDPLLASALHSFRQTSTTRCHEGHEEERECSTFSA